MKRRLRSVDGSYSCTSDVFEPDRYRQIFSIGAQEKIAVQGGGISYAATSFGGSARVINMRRFDRLLDFDPDRAIVEAEAGITVGRLHTFLAKHGFTVAVQPGHPQISLGGCIAANVHGKSHFREGLFADLVEQVRLFHPARGELTLSHEQHRELLELTCGGFGLTGIILSARIRIVPLAGNCFDVRHIPVSNLADTVARFNELKEDHDLLYSWNDLARFDRHMGRGKIVAGRLVERNPAPTPPRHYRRLDPHRKSIARVGIIRPATLRALNALYYFATRSARPSFLDLNRALFPGAYKSYYFGAYGGAGFLEHQILVPDSQISTYLEEFETLVRRHRQRFGLTALKLFRGNQKLLRYDGCGVNFSLHLANRPKSLALLEDLDALNIRNGVITNLVKDSRLSAATARLQYPEFELFARRLAEFDPSRLFVTALSSRLKI